MARSIAWNRLAFLNNLVLYDSLHLQLIYECPSFSHISNIGQPCLRSACECLCYMAATGFRHRGPLFSAGIGRLIVCARFMH
jgi:hypothetical protein